MDHIVHRVTRSKIASVAFFLSFAFVLGGWGWMYLTLRESTQPLILHYTNYTGITQVGSVSDLNPIGILSVLALIINTSIGLALEDRDWFLGKFVAGATLIWSILIFIGFAAIISVN